jgi:hypothetical protein
VLLLSALALSDAQAPSLGVTPPQVDLLDAQRGEGYEVQVEVQNQFDTPTEVTLTPLGETGNWTTSDPASGFQVPARTNQAITLTIAVPGDAPNGLHTGFLQLIAEPKEQPTGSGFALRYAVAVVLNVTVGGEAVVKLRWSDAEANDVEQGSMPDVAVLVRNEGNVRATPSATARILAPDGATLLLTGQGELEEAGDAGQLGLRPGQTATVRFRFDGAPLAARSEPYRAELRSTGPGELAERLPFHVVPVGTLGKEGALRFLAHEPWVDPGKPVKVTAVFENTGQALISAAKFTGEVSLDGQLVAVLDTDALVVPAGRSANLSAFFTPAEPGVYAIRGQVTFDGFTSEPNDSLLNVRAQAARTSGQGAGLALPLGAWAVGGLAALALAGSLVAVAAKRRRNRKAPEERRSKRR